jgi:hypothetical protein
MASKGTAIMHPHLYELDQVNVVIHQNHRAALQDEHLRALRGERQGRIAAIVMALRASVATLLIAAGERIRNEPVASSEPITSSGVAGEPADTAAVA